MVTLLAKTCIDAGRKLSTLDDLNFKCRNYTRILQTGSGIFCYYAGVNWRPSFFWSFFFRLDVLFLYSCQCSISTHYVLWLVCIDEMQHVISVSNCILSTLAYVFYTCNLFRWTTFIFRTTSSIFASIFLCFFQCQIGRNFSHQYLILYVGIIMIRPLPDECVTYFVVFLTKKN